MNAMAWMLLAALTAGPVDGNRLAYLDGHDIYYPHTKFPKLTTPQWVGDEGVEAVVILAIDDMRDTAKYESYLRPILQRLKQIDGRAPVSIMTCAVKPEDPRLQTWLEEGLSLEVHTFDHPCPLLQEGDFARAKGTYDKCVDLMFSIPNNTPVAYRMPCCDSLNTVSPRFYKEIFNKTTPNGKFLQISSSVFQVYTADDPEIPRELLFDADGQERFRKYFPKGLKRGEVTHDRFVNYVENYPYPYVIDGMCWEFPCMTPSDWEANFLHQPNNPKTVDDLKAALDITVIKQGVLNLVFHPHGWIQAEQVNELIDHAVARHGKKVKFLTFKEALERLNKNLLNGKSLRDSTGSGTTVRLIDWNGDGDLDVTSSEETAVWDDDRHEWLRHPVVPTSSSDLTPHPYLPGEFLKNLPLPFPVEFLFLRDLDGDGTDELIRGGTFRQFSPGNVGVAYVVQVFQQKDNQGQWRPVTATLPSSLQLTPLTPPARLAKALRFVDINEDGQLDIVFSDVSFYGAWLFESLDKGWSIELLSGQRGDKPASEELPPIVRADGTDNGFFVRDRALHWMNEDTAHLPNLIVSWDFDKLLGDRMPAAKTPKAAIQSMRVRPGFTVELMAHEPLVLDPVAFQWGPDGKLWVAEMADYPNGMDGRGQPGGRIRYLEDTDNDGRYDKSTLFLEGVSFPSGVHPWKNGVLVSAAPDIFFAADTDGDGKADVREVLYTGFGEGNQQHRVNGFTWGLDGWLYLANGDSGGTIRSTKTGQTLDIRGRDLRIQPETGKMEALSGQTQFGRARDDFGHWFGNNNSRPLWQYVLDDDYLARNPHLPTPDNRHDVSEQPGNAPVYPVSKTLTRFNDFHTANRFTSACGSMVSGEWSMVDGLRLMAKAKDSASSQPSTINPQPSTLSFSSEPVHNLVHCEVVDTSGIRFSSRRLPGEESSEFLASTDNWFRPTQLRMGPDGALWVADMYRLVIEHPQWIPLEWQERLNVRDGDDKGRLWRIFPNGMTPRAVPRLERMTPVELVAAMDSPSRWQRDMAQQLIIERVRDLRWSNEDKLACTGALRELFRTSMLPEVRVQVLYTLQGIGFLFSREMKVALTDPHPGVRMHAVRFAEHSPQLLSEDDRSPEDPAPDAIRLMDDEHPWVRLQLAATLGTWYGHQAADALARLLLHEDDPDIRAMALSSVNEENLPRLTAALLSAPGVDERSHPTLEPLLTCAIAMNQTATMESFSRFLLAKPPQQAEPWRWEAVTTWIESIRRKNESWSKWKQRTSESTPELADQWTKWLSELPLLIGNRDIAVSRRAEALRLAGWTNPALKFEPQWLQPTEAPELRQAALQLAASLPAQEAAALLVESWPRLSPALRETARQSLLGRVDVAKTFLDGVKAGPLTPANIDAETAQFLRSHRDAGVRELAESSLQTTDSLNRGAIVAEYLRTMPAEGQTAAGRELFAKRCAQCHKLGELGHAVGPDLAALTDKSVTALVTAVLDPNRAVEAKFLQFGVETTTGQVHTGLLSAESANSLSLLAAEAKTVSLLRSEIEDLWSVNKSLMPEGLEKEITPADLANLAAFIRGNVPLPLRKTFPGNTAQRVAASDNGSFVLTPATCEVYGPTIVIEPKYNNLGWWSSADDFVTWTLDVPTSGRYRVEIEYACDPQAAGHRLLAVTPAGQLSWTVKPTANWDDYQRAEIGTIELSSGVQPITLKPGARPLPALLDLRTVRLIRE
ncbi:MAG: HEAT repeat domain-containing protein [Planctomycetaceae bacterium]|nr:HEAT repeat domain-containing protein [Planctomycetaceae bacterium]